MTSAKTESGDITVGSNNVNVVIGNSGVVVQVTIRTPAGFVPIAFNWQCPKVAAFEYPVAGRPIEESSVLSKLERTNRVGTNRASVAIHGMGGMGKTTLARQVAHLAEPDYADGGDLG